MRFLACWRSCKVAVARAEALARKFIVHAKRQVCCDDCIVTLDGVGNNRRAFERVFAAEGLPCPRILTCECDPIVALCQRILYGADVILTGGDPSLRSKKRKNGCVGTPLIEDIILANRLPLESVRLLYLDYCGGPPAHIDMRRVLSKLPNLELYAGTVSKRRHAGLEQCFDRYIPCMYGFREQRTFLDNRRVVSKMFVRTEECRTIDLPGCFWMNCPNHLKRRRFRGVMVDRSTAAVETERGLEMVRLSKQARLAYAVSPRLVSRK